MVEKATGYTYTILVWLFKVLARLLLNASAVFLSAKYLPGVSVDSFTIAVVVSLTLGLFNTLLRPFLNLLAFPLNLVTFGLFSLVLNALLVFGVSLLIPGFDITSLPSALFLSLTLSVIGTLVGYFT